MWMHLWTQNAVNNRGANIRRVATAVARLVTTKEEKGTKTPVLRGIWRRSTEDLLTSFKLQQDTLQRRRTEVQNSIGNAALGAVVDVPAGQVVTPIAQPWMTRKFLQNGDRFFEGDASSVQCRGRWRPTSLILHTSLVSDLIKRLAEKIASSSKDPNTYMYDATPLCLQYLAALRRLSNQEARAEKLVTMAENMMEVAEGVNGDMFCVLEQVMNMDEGSGEGTEILAYRRKVAFFLRHLNTRKRLEQIARNDEKVQSGKKATWEKGTDLLAITKELQRMGQVM
jgi:hypothetical protein